jgi:hypothetical protein
VHRLGALGDEVELPVGLLAEGDRVGLLGMDEVGELDRVADEEDAEVIADQIPVAVLGVELDREPARVARRIRESRPPATVEKRRATSVRLPCSWKSLARVYFEIGSSPQAP